MKDDILLANATVISLDRHFPNATAVGVRGQRVVWVGAVEDATQEFSASYREVDLGGSTVVPGFVDAHHHIMMFGYWLSQIDCGFPEVTSIQLILAAVGERCLHVPVGEWVLGRGYDDNRLIEGRSLTRQDLDTVSPHHPVLIRNVSGHMCVANSAALRQAGVSRTSVSPFGGHIAVDAEGEPTGLLQEAAQELLGVPLLTSDKSLLREYLTTAGKAYLAAGVTSGHEAGIFTAAEFSVFQEARAEGWLPLRTYMMVRPPLFQAFDDVGLVSGFGDDRLRVGSLKLVSDGSLIGRTAAVSSPYEPPGDPEDLGIAMFTQEELNDLVWRAHHAGWQVAIHAIGDRAIDMCLDAYESAQALHPRPGARHRIEHCGVMRPDIIARMVRMGVIPVGQPPFISEFGDGFLKHLGTDRCRLTYPLKSLLEAGLPACGSSDSPVSSYRPLVGIQAAVTERTSGDQDFAPAEALTVEEALSIYTRNSAYAAFDEGNRGTIAPGKYADAVVLSRDPRLEPPDTIADIAVLATMQGGEFVFEASSA